MCAVFAKTTLTLTPWPLFRDAVYYCIGLIFLAIFFGVNNKDKGPCVADDQIEWYEALVLLALYGLYVCVMANSKKLKIFFCGKESGTSVSKTTENQLAEIELGHKDSSSKVDETSNAENTSTKSRKRIRFRAGFLKLMIGERTTEWAGVYLVASVGGNMSETFKTISESHKPDDFIDRDELKILLKRMSDGKREPTDADIDAIMDDVDEDKDGQINAREFARWYVIWRVIVSISLSHNIINSITHTHTQVQPISRHHHETCTS